MRDVNVIAIECMRELENIGIKCGNVIKIDINTRAKKRWGQCRKIGNNYIIEVNQILLREDTDIDGLKNTIIHELLHTCKGCMKHTGEWKQLAEKSIDIMVIILNVVIVLMKKESVKNRKKRSRQKEQQEKLNIFLNVRAAVKRLKDVEKANLQNTRNYIDVPCVMENLKEYFKET